MDESVLEIKQGNQQAFAEAFDLHYQKVFAFLMHRTHGNRDRAMELTQLTFIRLWRSRHSLSTAYTLDKQLFIMTKSTLIDDIRRASRERKGIQQLPTSPTEGLPDAQHLSFETTDHVVHVMKKLPPVRKKVLQMKILYGYTNREIAEQLSISIKTVEDHVTKGLHELRGLTHMPGSFVVFFFLHASISSIVN